MSEGGRWNGGGRWDGGWGRVMEGGREGACSSA